MLVSFKALKNKKTKHKIGLRSAATNEMPIIPALEKRRQEDQEFKVSLHYCETLSQKTGKTKQNKEI